MFKKEQVKLNHLVYRYINPKLYGKARLSNCDTISSIEDAMEHSEGLIGKGTRPILNPLEGHISLTKPRDGIHLNLLSILLQVTFSHIVIVSHPFPTFLFLHNALIFPSHVF